MDILYIASDDPNSHGYTLKYYWEKYALGNFDQITRARGRPWGKKVDIEFEAEFKADSPCRIKLPDGTVYEEDAARKYVGDLAEKADLIHVDRPRMASLRGLKMRLPPLIINGKETTWGKYLQRKPCVFNYRGSLLIKSFATQDIKDVWSTCSHAVPVYCNPPLRILLPPNARMLPFCAHEESWINVPSKRPSKFTVAHASTSHAWRPAWLFKKNYWKQVKGIVEDINDFKCGNDAGGDESLLGTLSKFFVTKGIEVDIIRNIPHPECLARLANASCFFEDYRFFGSYGHGALEAMYFRKPILNGVSQLFLKEIGENPFLQTENIEQLKHNAVLLSQNNDLYLEYQEKIAQFYDRFHRPEITIKEYLVPIYEEAMKRFKAQ